MAVLMRYENSPGPRTNAPARWPAYARVVRDPARANLVMLLHPRCPCSRASIGELDRLLARCQGRLAAHVVFLQPSSAGEAWARTDLWRAAAAIPGVDVMLDEGGAECARFHAATSGQTLLYDSAGRLQFEGGITPSRGRHGDNAGSSAILALMKNERAPSRRTSVFGCSLVDPSEARPERAPEIP